jgi:CheY-like chemotaxis protein
MPTRTTEIDNQGVIEIRDPELDVAELMRRIRQNMAVREKQPPLAALLGQARLLEERQALRRTIGELHARVNNYGSIDSLRTGWRARAEVFVKKCIRKLLGRYVAQQQEVHNALLAVIYQLTGYLDRQDEVLGQRFDQCDHQFHDTAVRLRKAALAPPCDSRSPDASAA